MPRKQRSSEYRGYRTAGIRLGEELLPHLVSHRTERVADLLAAIHAFDKAHLAMLTEEGLIPRADGVAMLRALRDTERQGGADKARFASEGGVHSGEQHLIRLLGEAVGGRMHLGRSSGDLDEVARRIAVRGHMLTLMTRLIALRRTLLRRAAEHAATVMPGYTQGQHAQPTTFGHFLSMWALVFARGFARLAQLYARVNLSPAGAAIMTGSEFPVNRARMAALLGFDAPLPHTLDAIMSHDVDLEIASALAILGADLARLGGDLMLFMTAEFAMIDVPDRFCGTSSIMMQKKNPYAPQEMKALAAEAAGGLMTALYVEKDPTGVAILERRRTERAFWSVLAMAERRLADAEEIVAALVVKKERMLALAGAHWAPATDLAGALVRERGLPWRSAHQIVGILVRLAEERGLGPADATPALLDEAAVEYDGTPMNLSVEAVAQALDPAACVARRTLFGGPAPEAAKRELAGFESELLADEAALAGLVAGVAAGETLLEGAIESLLQQP